MPAHPRLTNREKRKCYLGAAGWGTLADMDAVADHVGRVALAEGRRYVFKRRGTSRLKRIVQRTVSDALTKRPSGALFLPPRVRTHVVERAIRSSLLALEVASAATAPARHPTRDMHARRGVVRDAHRHFVDRGIRPSVAAVRKRAAEMGVAMGATTVRRHLASWEAEEDAAHRLATLPMVSRRLMEVVDGAVVQGLVPCRHALADVGDHLWDRPSSSRGSAHYRENRLPEALAAIRPFFPDLRLDLEGDCLRILAKRPRGWERPTQEALQSAFAKGGVDAVVEAMGDGSRPAPVALLAAARAKRALGETFGSPEAATVTSALRVVECSWSGQPPRLADTQAVVDALAHPCDRDYLRGVVRAADELNLRAGYEVFQYLRNAPGMRCASMNPHSTNVLWSLIHMLDPQQDVECRHERVKRVRLRMADWWLGLDADARRRVDIVLGVYAEAGLGTVDAVAHLETVRVWNAERDGTVLASLDAAADLYDDPGAIEALKRLAPAPVPAPVPKTVPIFDFLTDLAKGDDGEDEDEEDADSGSLDGPRPVSTGEYPSNPDTDSELAPGWS